MAQTETVEIVVKETGAEKTRDKVRGVGKATDKTKKSAKDLVGGLLNMSGGLKGVAMAAGAAGGALIALQAAQKVIDLFKRATKATIDFTKELSRLGAEQEKGRNIMIGLIGDVKKGTEAYDKFDEAVTMTALDKQIFDMKAYADAVGKGLGDAYLDAARAGTVMEVRQRTLMRALAKMDAGIKPTQDTLVDLKAVLDRTGISMEDINSGAISLAETSKLLKAGLKEVGDAQEEAAGKTLIGNLNVIKGVWVDIREAAGEFLNRFLKPIVVEVKKALIESQEWEGIMTFMKASVMPALLATTGLIVGHIKAVVGLIKTVEIVAQGVLKVFGKIREKVDPLASKFDSVVNLIRGIKEESHKLGTLWVLISSIMNSLVRGEFKNAVSFAKLLKKEINEIQQREEERSWSAKKSAESSKRQLDNIERYNKLIDEVGEKEARIIAEREMGRKFTPEEIEFARTYLGREAPEEELEKEPVGLGVSDEKISEETQKLIDAWAAYLEARKELSDRASEREAEKLQAEYDEAMEAFNKAYDAVVAKIAKEEAFGKAVASSITSDIRSAVLEGADVSDIFANRLANAVEAALGDAITRAMAKMGLQQALSAIPIIGPFLGALLGVGQEGLYTGEQAGLYQLHEHEAVLNPSATQDLVNLVNRGLLNPNINVTAPATEMGVNIMVEEKASDLVDIHRAESVGRGEKNLDSLVGVPF